MDIRELHHWAETVQCAGGVDDQDVIEAITAATELCWSFYDKGGAKRNEMAQLGIKWTAAFMVSCARNGASDNLAALIAPTTTRRAIFFREAMKNEGTLQEVLREAAAVPERLSDSAMSAIGF